MSLKFRNNILLEYISRAPLPLALERSAEGQIFSGLEFERPVLDLGCGEGLFAQSVFTESLEAGIDPNPRELERAQIYGRYVQLIQCSGNAIPMPDNSFKTIFSNSVLEHIPDLEPVLREVHRLLAPGGRFYLTVPSDQFDAFTVGNQVLTQLGLLRYATQFRSWFNSFWRHYHFYSLDQWKNLLRRNGFEVVQAYRYNSKVLCLLNDALVPFSVFGFVLKKLFNQWTVAPGLRKIIFYPVYGLARALLKKHLLDEQGGLIFMALTKVH
ncbi:MAG: methyltransferase domain-containing protein [Terriglobia bacterium]